MRIFTTERRVIEADAILPLLALPAESLRSRLHEGERLL
jgi:hypothetical protein